jgi:hypothetical protein
LSPKNNAKAITDNCILDFLASTREAADNKFDLVSQTKRSVETPYEPQFDSMTRGIVGILLPFGSSPLGSRSSGRPRDPAIYPDCDALTRGLTPSFSPISRL